MLVIAVKKTKEVLRYSIICFISDDLCPASIGCKLLTVYNSMSIPNGKDLQLAGERGGFV